MAVLKQIKLNDITFDLPSVEMATANLNSVMAQVGCTAAQMTDALRQISDLMKQMTWASTEITDIKDALADLQYHCEGRDGSLSARVDLVEYKLDELRSDMDARTEIPNQKDDLEIFNRIVPTGDFLILGDVGWSAEIMDLDKTNMFLN